MIGLIIPIIIWLAITISFLLIPYFWLGARRNGRESRFSGKVVTFCLISGIISFFLCVGTVNRAVSSISGSDNTSQSSPKNADSSEESKTEESEEAESVTDDTTLDQLNKSKLLKYNSGLNKMLVEDQQLYTNGQEEFAWTMFVSKIEFDKNAGLVMYVNSDFLSLNKNERKTVGNRAQNLAKAQMAMMDLPTSQDDATMYLSIHDESNDRIGHSSAWNTANFKWSD